MKIKIPFGYLCFLCGTSVLVALVVCLLFSPRFVLWRGLGLNVQEVAVHPEINRAADMLMKVDAPFSPIENSSNRVIQWRLLFPLIWHSLSLPKILFLALPHIGCFLALGMFAHVAYGATGNRLLSMAITALLGASSWFFVSTGWLTYFDSWLVLGLTAVVFARPRLALSVVCLLCPWIDERFIIALPLCVILRFINFQSIEKRDYRSMWLDAASVLPMIFFYAAIRIGVSFYNDDYSVWYLRGQLAPDNIVSVPFLRYLEGVWAGMRGGIFFVLLLLWLACAKSPWGWRLALWSVFLSTLVVSLLIACDLSRSMEIFVPAVLSGIVLTARKLPSILRFVIPGALAVSFILPAKHVITSFTININPLWTEIAWYRNPPEFLRPEYYLLKAIPLVKKGEFDMARFLLDRAIRLDGQFAPAYLWSASLLVSQGNLSEAIVETDKAIRINPKSPDAFYLRGVIHQARKEPKEAEADFVYALQIAGPDWSQFNECVRRIAHLQR